MPVQDQATAQAADVAFPSTIQYRDLKQTNPAYAGDFWAQCRALYTGGPTLLNDDSMLKRVMPQHNAELETVYAERRKRAFYIPYAGSIIDKIVSELTGKPITVELTEDLDAPPKADKKRSDPPDAEVPDYYKELFADCAPVGGLKRSIQQLAREQMLVALQCQTAWSLIDMPIAPEAGYSSLAEQDKAKARDAYVCPIAPENIIDWECDSTGEFTFVLVKEILNPRMGLTSSRDLITLRYRYYTCDQWAVYELQYSKKVKPQGPSDIDEAKLISKGVHAFKRVPVRRLALPEGLWAMGKLEAMARTHLNQRNALSWAQLKALFPVPVLYAAPPSPLDPTSEDSNRTQQRTGPGLLWVMAEKDKLEYFSPDTAPYAVAREDLNSIRDEMYRVMHHMAMSVDNSGAALGRSADSKAIDQVVASILLKALGQILREHVEDIYDTISVGRGENLDFSCKGWDSFEDSTVSQMIADAVSLEQIDIPSATFQKARKFKFAKTYLGPDASQQDLEAIEDELDESITQDDIVASKQFGLMAQDPTLPKPGQDPTDPKKDPDADPGDPVPEAPKAQPAKDKPAKQAKTAKDKTAKIAKTQVKPKKK